MSAPAAAALAALHARCFTAPPPWSAQAIAGILAGPGAFLLTAQDPAAGFLIGRAAAGEAELLTVAVAPEARRAGIGRALCARFAAAAREAGADAAFLEVEAGNAAARALYHRGGWTDVGQRRGYYGRGLDAVVMRLDLTAPAQVLS